MNYRDGVESVLNETGWKLMEVGTVGYWWRDEQWRLRSVRASYGREPYVTFVVDPMLEGNRRRGQGVYCVRASRVPLEAWNDGSTTVAEIYMSKRRFDDKPVEFKAGVHAYQYVSGTPDG